MHFKNKLPITKLLHVIITKYIKDFNLFKLIIGAFCLSFVILSYAFIIVLAFDISLEYIFVIKNNVVFFIIVIRFIFTPLTIYNILDFFIVLSLNIFILTICSKSLGLIHLRLPIFGFGPNKPLTLENDPFADYETLTKASAEKRAKYKAEAETIEIAKAQAEAKDKQKVYAKTRAEKVAKARAEQIAKEQA